MSEHPSLHIRQVLRRRGLPEAQFENIWAGFGTGATCAHCGNLIETDDIEYELRFRQGIDVTGIQLHRECWEIWWHE